MRRNIILISYILISVSLFSEAIYNGNISVVENDFFSGFDIDDPGIYAGGSNTFPIGSYVEIKLPHSDNKVSVKVVRRIPETGRFILVDENAGNQLGLTMDDVVLVSVVVKKFIPNPSDELDSFTPEPEIKGFTSEVAEIGVETETTLETADESLPLTETPSEELESKVKEIEMPEESDELVYSEETIDSDKLAADDSLMEKDDVKEVTMDVSEKEPEKKVSNTKVVDNTIFDDVEDSMFSEIPELEEEIEEFEDKIVKRVYFLEPANSKPPVGGIPDKDLVPVTKNDKAKDFKDGYYLQVGIYGDPDLLSEDQIKLDEYFLPYLSVKKEEGDKKDILLVGPLTNDEQGVIMLYLKDKGFYDFFKYKKKP